MNNATESTSFRSRRSQALAPEVPAENAELPTPETTATERSVVETSPTGTPLEIVKILVISANKGLGKMIGQALGGEAATKVDFANNSLADLHKEATDFLDGYNIVVFEANPGNDLELHALRKLKATRPEDVKFLAMTAGELTLAYAKELMEAGVDEVLPLSSIKPDLRDTVALEPHMEEALKRRGSQDRNGAIVAITQTRGGIGATSAALGMAYELSKPPKVSRKVQTPDAKRVAVVDLDIQNGNLGAFVDLEDSGNVIEMLRSSDLPDGDDLKAMMVSYSDTLDVFPAPTEFAPLEALTPEMMATLLDELRYAYDVVILNLPRVILPWLEAVLARTDQMIIITDTAVPSIRQARRLIDLFSEDHVSMPIEIAISMEKKRFSPTEAQKEASAILERSFTHWIPRDDTAAQKANDGGKPVTEMAERSSLAKSLKELCRVIEKAHSNTIRRRA